MTRCINVGLIGVGNCASALVQGVHYYTEDKPGLIHWDVGGYCPRSIRFTCAFDVDATKVGTSLDEAISAGNNNTRVFADVPHLDAIVHRCPALDGLGDRYKERIDVVEGSTASQIVDVLRSTNTEVLVNYLPVGSCEATQWWAHRAIEARCGFVNCIPEFIATKPEWQRRFADAGLPLIGDDVKSQVGATIVHRVLAKLMKERGIKIDRTYQLNFGGNMDFYNMLNSNRLTSKRESKRSSVESEIGDIERANIHISPSDYVEWLTDQKWCYIRIEGTAFGGSPLNLELKLEVWDSPNSAGVVMDLVRWCKVALDRRCGGVLLPVCSCYMKSPPNQLGDAEAIRALHEWDADGHRAQ